MDPQPDVKLQTPTRSVFHEAPEVAHEAPILAHSESDGLQSAYPHDEKSAPYYSQRPLLAPEPATRPSRKWLWIVGAVVAALIGLGAGIGIGFAVGNGGSSEKSTTCLPAQTVTVTATTTTNSTTSATASAAPVTSGTTGIAAFSCNTSSPDNTYTSSASSSTTDQILLTFTEECFVDYPGGSATANDTGTVSDVAARTVYSFQSCMDQCVLYTDGISSGQQPCLGVTYDANLTASVLAHGGNCWLKSARGQRAAHGDDGALYASAYLTSQPFAS